MRASPSVLLLQPPGACRTFTRSGSVYPPLGLCQIAATVDAERAVVLDADGLGWDDARTWTAIEAARPLVIGMTATTGMLELVERHAAAAAARGIRVVVGGPQASLAPRQVLDACPSVDWVVLGEGELIFPDLVARIEAGRSPVGLPGVVGRGGALVLLGATPARVVDFSTLPFPRLAGLPIANYQCPDARRRPMVTFASTRGCPHRCGFCSSPALLGKKVRGFPVCRVLDELERLVAQVGVREVSFVDDVFTIQPRRVIELCGGMIERGLDLTWFCNARADQVTGEMAQVMAASGCHQVYLGFESGSQQILDRVEKGATIENLERGAEILRRVGIGRSVGFVIGLPGESDATVNASIALAHRVRPERIQFTRFTPLVGSPLYDEVSISSQGFHSREGDEVDGWIRRAYDSCASESWGKPSL